MDKNLRSYLIELAGTFGLVFVSAGAVIATQLGGDATARPSALAQTIYVALAVGFVYAAILAITMPYEGGYLNPAITLTMWVYKRFEGAKTVALIFVQLLGAAIAGGLLFLIFHENEPALLASSLGTPHVNPDLTPYLRTPVISGAIVEFALTFVLTLVIFGTTLDPRAPKLLGPTGQWLTPLWIGLAMAALVLIAYPMTGAAGNPARWFGTFMWEYGADQLKVRGPARDQLAYWVGPILGALLGGGVYNALLMPDEPEPTAHATGTPASGGKHPAGSTLFKAKK
jgi:aquaporin TIP